MWHIEALEPSAKQPMVQELFLLHQTLEVT
jgi:hypothetical protein